MGLRRRRKNTTNLETTFAQKHHTRKEKQIWIEKKNIALINLRRKSVALYSASPVETIFNGNYKNFTRRRMALLYILRTLLILNTHQYLRCWKTILDSNNCIPHLLFWESVEQ